MSLILKTISAFPRGRTTEELLVLVGAGFAHDKRVGTVSQQGWRRAPLTNTAFQAMANFRMASRRRISSASIT